MKTAEEQLKELRSKIDALEKQLNKPELVPGKVYYFEIKTLKWIASLDKVEDDRFHYNWMADTDSEFGNKNWCSLKYLVSEATNEQILEILKPIAIEKGLVNGVTVSREGMAFYDTNGFKKPAYGYYEVNITNDIYAIDRDGDLTISGRIIFESSTGIWAKPIEEKLFIGKYEVRFENGSVFIDVYEFDKEFWEAAKNASKHSKASVLLGCGAKGKGSFSWVASSELIDKILNRLNK